MLFRFDPFADFDRFAGGASNGPRATRMPVDALRRDDAVVLRFDVPGIEPDAVEVTVDKGVLKVSAERGRPETNEGESYSATERWAGTRSRWLRLGDHLDADALAATIHNGVLTVTIPVAETATPRRIAISTPTEAALVDAGVADGGAADTGVVEA